MADDAKPNIIVMGFFSTFERRPVRDEFGDFVLLPNGQRKMALQEIDWVKYCPASSPIAMLQCERIRHIEPAGLERILGIRSDAGNEQAEGNMRLEFFRYRWRQIEPAYKAWKAGVELTSSGTSLKNWAALRPEHVAEFAKLRLFTVEEVAKMPTAIIGRLNLPNAAGYKTMAQTFLSQATDAAALLRDKERDDEIAELRDSNATMLGLMEELRAELKRARSADEGEDEGEDDGRAGDGSIGEALAAATATPATTKPRGGRRQPLTPPAE